MSSFSTYMQNQNLNWIKGTDFDPAPANVYIALFDGSPTDAGTGGTEVTTTVRPAGRVEVTYGSIAGGSMASNADVDFGTSSGSATITHFALYDASSGGNLLMHNSLNSSRSVTAGSTVVFSSADITATVD